jgi:integrase
VIVEIRDRNGWKYAVVPRQRGLGRAIVRRLGTRSMDEALALVRLSDLEKQALAAKADAIGLDVWTRLVAGRRVRVRDAVAQFTAYEITVGHADETIERRAGTLDQFMRATGLANEPIAAITADYIAAFVNPRDSSKLGTREQRLKRMTAFMEFCFGKGWVVSNPTLGVAVRVDGLTQEQLIEKPHEAFTDDEIVRLLAAIPRSSFWHGAVLLGREFAFRISTVIELEWSNVDGHQLRVYTKKGKRIVNGRLPDDLIAWLEEWKLIRPVSDLPYIFPAEAAAGSAAATKNFSRLVRRIGIQGKTFHGLRKHATARVWNNALDSLGDEKAKLLAKLVSEHGYRKVQTMLAHAPGSDVTDRHYLPKVSKD